MINDYVQSFINVIAILIIAKHVLAFVVSQKNVHRKAVK